MSKLVRCDGCAKTLNQSSREIAITGHRADAPNTPGSHPSATLDRRLPGESFDWCHQCAIVAFTAVAAILDQA